MNKKKVITTVVSICILVCLVVIAFLFWSNTDLAWRMRKDAAIKDNDAQALARIVVSAPNHKIRSGAVGALFRTRISDSKKLELVEDVLNELPFNKAHSFTFGDDMVTSQIVLGIVQIKRIEALQVLRKVIGCLLSKAHDLGRGGIGQTGGTTIFVILEKLPEVFHEDTLVQIGLNSIDEVKTNKDSDRNRMKLIAEWLDNHLDGIVLDQKTGKFILTDH